MAFLLVMDGSDGDFCDGDPLFFLHFSQNCDTFILIILI